MRKRRLLRKTKQQRARAHELNTLKWAATQLRVRNKDLEVERERLADAQKQLKDQKDAAISVNVLLADRAREITILKHQIEFHAEANKSLLWALSAAIRLWA